MIDTVNVTIDREGAGAANAMWPAEDLETVGCCPACMASARAALYENLPDVVFGCAAGRWKLWRCSNCGTGYLDPRPTPQSISRAYATYYTHLAPADPAVGMQRSSPIGRMLIGFVNGYLNARYGYRLAPSNPMGKYLLSLTPLRRARADHYVRRLALPHRGARLLDVGCGNGDFLLLMRIMGWEVVGQDFDRSAVETARAAGLDVRLGQLSECGLEEGSLDAICMNHVIEHIYDPVETLQLCFRLLKPGGILSLVTPNIASDGSALYGAAWRGLEVPRHLAIMTPRALRSVCETAGFLVKRQGGNAEAASYFRRSSAIAAGMVGDKALPLTLSMKLRALLCNVAACLGSGRADEMFLVAQRPGAL